MSNASPATSAKNFSGPSITGSSANFRLSGRMDQEVVVVDLCPDRVLEPASLGSVFEDLKAAWKKAWAPKQTIQAWSSTSSSRLRYQLPEAVQEGRRWNIQNQCKYFESSSAGLATDSLLPHDWKCIRRDRIPRHLRRPWLVIYCRGNFSGNDLSCGAINWVVGGATSWSKCHVWQITDSHRFYLFGSSIRLLGGVI